MKNTESQDPPDSGINLNPSKQNDLMVIDNQVQVFNQPMYFAGGSLKKEEKVEPNPHLNEDRYQKIPPIKGFVQPKFHPIEDEPIHQNKKWKPQKQQPQRRWHQNPPIENRGYCYQTEVYQIKSDWSCCQFFLSFFQCCFPSRQNYKPTVTFRFNNKNKILTVYQKQEWCSLSKKRICCCWPPQSHIEIPYNYIIGIQRVRKNGKDKVRLNTKARNLSWDYKQDPRCINSYKVARDLAQLCNKCGILLNNPDSDIVPSQITDQINWNVVFINNENEYRLGIKVTQYQ